MIRNFRFKVHSVMELLPYIVLSSSIVILHAFSLEGGINMLTVGVMAIASVFIFLDTKK